MRGLILLLFLIAATASVSGGYDLMHRQLWMDEVHSWLIVTDQHPSHAMDALADGADFNPPMWFLITRWLTAMTAPATELQLRLLSLTWMLLALSGLYMLLSREFAPHVCVIAVLLTASHPLLIHQSTEIRFYGFWCACSVWLCNALQWRPIGGAMRQLQMVAVPGLTICTTTCHYFGVLSILLMVLPFVFRRRRDSDGFRLAVLAAISSIGSLASCVHILGGQKAALSRPTWISPTTLKDSFLFVQALFPAWQVLLCAAALAISLTAAKRFTSRISGPEIAAHTSRLLPCLCLTGMPVMIILVAWCLQPALVTRYAIVGLAGFAPLFAMAINQCSPRLQALLSIMSVLGLAYTIGQCADQWIRTDFDRMALILRLEQCPKDALIVFEDRIQFMSIVYLSPKCASRCVLAEFAESDMTDDSSLRIVQRDAGRRIQKWYPKYGMLPIAALAAQPLFFIVPYANGTPGDLAYPGGYSISVQSTGVFRFDRLGSSPCPETNPDRLAFESPARRAAGKHQEMF